jgi:urate oxidase
MARRVVDEIKDVKEVTYTLPNRHYVPVNMQYLGVENIEPLSIIYVSKSLPRSALAGTLLDTRKALAFSVLG